MMQGYTRSIIIFKLSPGTSDGPVTAGPDTYM